MPKDVSAELHRGNRLSPALLKKMIRWIVDAMMDACPKPLRRESALVAKQLVQKYRDSLEDRLNGDVVGNGYEGVLCSMQNRIDNQCRGRSDIPRKRRPRSASASVQSQEKNPRLDNYGCKNWQPDLPDGESAESQEEIRLQMINVFGRGEKEWNSERSKVKDLMVRSFHSQRKSINEGKDMSDIKEAWPFLFEFLFVHFEELMGFPLLSTLMAAI